MRSRAWLAVGGVVFLCTCVKAPTRPTPSPTPSPPPLTGNFTLAIEASSVCRLPTSKYQWDVEGTATGTGQGSGVRATLPGGDNSVDVSLTYSSASMVNGSITARSATFDETLKVNITGVARGGLASDSGGRGQVRDGVLNGAIALSNVEDRENNTLGSCTAADHKWTLTPR